MDVAATASRLFANFSWTGLIFAVLFLISEVLGASPNVKTSSIYEIGKAILATFKDQVVPQKAPAQVEPAATPKA